ncbi:hypothetical protein P4S72_23445 [Vibrio sp. PP-XX7]
MVKIAAYNKVGGGVAALMDWIVAPYEMSSLVSQHSNCVKQEKTAGGDGAVAKFNYSEPSEIKLKLLLDDTTFTNLVAYVLPANLIPDNVDSTIKTLLDHGPRLMATRTNPFVRVTPLQMPLVAGAGSGFGGFLTHVAVNNDIVDGLGNRVKASVDLTFMQVKTAEASNKEIGRSSPDLTHILQTYGGDTLVNKVQAIYGDPQFVHAVAEYNDLSTIRQITPGDSVKFPPLDR